MQERAAADRSIEATADSILRRTALVSESFHEDTVVEEFVQGNGREGALPLGGEPEGPQGHFQLGRIVNAFQQHAQDGVGDGRGADAAGETPEIPHWAAQGERLLPGRSLELTLASYQGLEPDQVVPEAEADASRRAVAVLGEDEFGDVAGIGPAGEVLVPLLLGVVGVLPVDEQDDVGRPARCCRCRGGRKAGAGGRGGSPPPGLAGSR